MFKRIVMVGCLVILLAQATFQVVMAQTDSQTTDEAVHVLAGYTYLTKRDYRLNPEHPPLVKTLAALPLLAIKPNLPADFEQKWQDSENFFYDSWRENRYLGEKFFYASGNDADLMILLSRLPMILLTLLLGLAIFLIVWRHFGAIAALAATGFYVLDPLVAGHGHLVTTDIAFGLGTLLTTYAGWRFFGSPNWKNALWLGLALGLALLTKHTAVILGMMLLITAVWIVATNKQAWQQILRGTGIV
ncbi:MAG: glycosyltransferase family 39 protein, partial [Patescibacteria group bacterium]